MATYKLARAGGGRFHFAEVSVVLGNIPDTMITPGADVDKTWIDAAKQGAQFALTLIDCESQVSITSVRGTIADTVATSVFCAAAMATLQLFGNDDNPWSTIRPSGE
jgi:hypothetical protein